MAQPTVFTDAALSRDIIRRAQEQGYRVSFGANNELLLDHEHVLDVTVQRCPVCLALSWPEWGEAKELESALEEDLRMAAAAHSATVRRIRAWYALRKSKIMTDANVGEWAEALARAKING